MASCPRWRVGRRCGRLRATVFLLAVPASLTVVSPGAVATTPPSSQPSIEPPAEACRSGTFPVALPPDGPPDAPAVAARTGNGQVTLTWAPPAAAPSTPVAYDITWTSGGPWRSSRRVSGASTVIADFHNGDAVDFTVTAVYADGATSATTASRARPAVGHWFHPAAPFRLLDTRPASPVGPVAGPWRAGEQRALPVTGTGDVPADACAVVFDVTAVDATEPTYLSVWPTGTASPAPPVSSLNTGPGRVVSNSVTAAVGTGGTIEVHNHRGRVDLVVDVVGWYDDSPGPGFSKVDGRVLDTRTTGDPWGPGQTRTLTREDLHLPDGQDTLAVMLNVTAVDGTAPSFLSVWPAGAPAPGPLVSSMNWRPGQTVAHLVTVGTGTGGVQVRNEGGTVHLAVDLVGRFGEAAAPFVPAAPRRLLDTRVPPQAGLGYGGMFTVAPATGFSDKAVLLNATVTDTTADSYLHVWRYSRYDANPEPPGSNLNWTAGDTVANAIVAGVDGHGEAMFSNAAGSADLILDLVGTFTWS